MLAPGRHVVHAAQDAAVRRLGEQDLLLPQIAERPRRQFLAAELPPGEAGDQLARSTQEDAVTSASKIVNSGLSASPLLREVPAHDAEAVLQRGVEGVGVETGVRAPAGHAIAFEASSSGPRRQTWRRHSSAT